MNGKRSAARRAVVIVTGLGLCGFAACVGSDPAPAGSVVIADEDGAVPPTYGIFLSSTKLHANFAKDTPDGGQRAAVNAFCASLAEDAGLPNHDRYQALLVSERGSEAALPLITVFNDVSGRPGRWCSIPSGGARPAQPECKGLGLVFPSPESFLAGPLHEVVTDERGTFTKVQEQFTQSRSVFFSGLFLPEGVLPTQGLPRNCDGWTVLKDAGSIRLDASSLPPEKTAFAVGTTGAVDAGVRWLGLSYAPCETPYELPLLCLELPPPPQSEGDAAPE